MDNSMDKELDQQSSGDESFFEFDAHLDAMAPQTDQATREETKLIRRMQMMMGMVMNVIAQDGSLTIDDASQMIADARTAALTMFPGKELAYDLIWRPRFQRLMCERFRLM
jgi:sorbitol-specific phosphotransferase system component IIBC